MDLLSGWNTFSFMYNTVDISSTNISKFTILISLASMKIGLITNNNLVFGNQNFNATNPYMLYNSGDRFTLKTESYGLYIGNFELSLFPPYTFIGSYINNLDLKSNCYNKLPECLSTSTSNIANLPVSCLNETIIQGPYVYLISTRYPYTCTIPHDRICKTSTTCSNILNKRLITNTSFEKEINAMFTDDTRINEILLASYVQNCQVFCENNVNQCTQNCTCTLGIKPKNCSRQEQEYNHLNNTRNNPRYGLEEYFQWISDFDSVTRDFVKCRKVVTYQCKLFNDYEPSYCESEHYHNNIFYDKFDLTENVFHRSFICDSNLAFPPPSFPEMQHIPPLLPLMPMYPPSFPPHEDCYYGSNFRLIDYPSEYLNTMCQGSCIPECNNNFPLIIVTRLYDTQHYKGWCNPHKLTIGNQQIFTYKKETLWSWWNGDTYLTKHDTNRMFLNDTIKRCVCLFDQQILGDTYESYTPEFKCSKKNSPSFPPIPSPTPPPHIQTNTDTVLNVTVREEPITRIEICVESVADYKSIDFYIQTDAICYEYPHQPFTPDFSYLQPPNYDNLFDLQNFSTDYTNSRIVKTKITPNWNILLKRTMNNKKNNYYFYAEYSGSSSFGGNECFNIIVSSKPNNLHIYNSYVYTAELYRLSHSLIYNWPDKKCLDVRNFPVCNAQEWTNCVNINGECKLRREYSNSSNSNLCYHCMGVNNSDISPNQCLYEDGECIIRDSENKTQKCLMENNETCLPQTCNRNTLKWHYISSTVNLSISRGSIIVYNNKVWLQTDSELIGYAQSLPITDSIGIKIYTNSSISFSINPQNNTVNSYAITSKYGLIGFLITREYSIDQLYCTRPVTWSYLGYPPENMIIRPGQSWSYSSEENAICYLDQISYIQTHNAPSDNSLLIASPPPLIQTHPCNTVCFENAFSSAQTCSNLSHSEVADRMCPTVCDSCYNYPSNSLYSSVSSNLPPYIPPSFPASPSLPPPPISPISYIHHDRIDIVQNETHVTIVDKNTCYELRGEINSDDSNYKDSCLLKAMSQGGTVINYNGTQCYMSIRAVSKCYTCTNASLVTLSKYAAARWIQSPHFEQFCSVPTNAPPSPPPDKTTLFVGNNRLTCNIGQDVLEKTRYIHYSNDNIVTNIISDFNAFKIPNFNVVDCDMIPYNLSTPPHAYVMSPITHYINYRSIENNISIIEIEDNFCNNSCPESFFTYNPFSYKYEQLSKIIIGNSLRIHSVFQYIIIIFSEFLNDEDKGKQFANYKNIATYEITEIHIVWRCLSNIFNESWPSDILNEVARCVTKYICGKVYDEYQPFCNQEVTKIINRNDYKFVRNVTNTFNSFLANITEYILSVDYPVSSSRLRSLSQDISSSLPLDMQVFTKYLKVETFPSVERCNITSGRGSIHVSNNSNQFKIDYTYLSKTDYWVTHPSCINSDSEFMNSLFGPIGTNVISYMTSVAWSLVKPFVDGNHSSLNYSQVNHLFIREFNLDENSGPIWNKISYEKDWKDIEQWIGIWVRNYDKVLLEDISIDFDRNQQYSRCIYDTIANMILAGTINIAMYNETFMNILLQENMEVNFRINTSQIPNTLSTINNKIYKFRQYSPYLLPEGLLEKIKTFVNSITELYNVI